MGEYRWLLFAVLGALFAAVVNVLTKKALNRMDVTVALAVQAMSMLLTIGVAVTLLRRWSHAAAAPRWALGPVALSGLAAGLSWLCGYYALQLSQVAKSAPIDKLSMPLAVVLAMVFLSERPTGMNWLGIGLMVAGAFFVAQGGE